MINFQLTRTFPAIACFCFPSGASTYTSTMTLPGLFSCSSSTGLAAGGPRTPGRPSCQIFKLYCVTETKLKSLNRHIRFYRNTRLNNYILCIRLTWTSLCIAAFNGLLVSWTVRSTSTCSGPLSDTSPASIRTVPPSSPRRPN